MSAKFSAHTAWRGEFRLQSEPCATEIPAVPSTKAAEGKFLTGIIDTQLNSADKPKLLAEVCPSILHVCVQLHASCIYSWLGCVYAFLCMHMHGLWLACNREYDSDD